MSHEQLSSLSAADPAISAPWIGVTAGESRTVSVLGEIARGETIGELAMFTGEPRSASIVALRNSLVVKVTRAAIESTVSHDPQIGLLMTRLVIERFRRGALGNEIDCIAAELSRLGSCERRVIVFFELPPWVE